MFASVGVTAAERATARPGDEIVVPADVVMDRGATFQATPALLWPWLVQLGKHRSGWYLTRAVERLVPRSRRAIRYVEPRWQGLAVGDVVPDWGGRDETFEVLALEERRSIVYGSRRGRTELTWSITVVPVDPARTRVFFRLRLAPVKRTWLATSVGDYFDGLTIAGMVAGLRERLAESAVEQ